MDSEFGRRLIKTTKVSEMTDFLTEFISKYRVVWKPVGDNDNNLAIINLGSDPGAGVIERITNAIDALIDLEWNKRGEPPHITSPRSAAEQWFSIPGGQLAEIKREDLKLYENTSKNIRVTLQDGDCSDRPTIDIRDCGIGILAEEFNETILSLNKNRKLRKLFLAGAFGQGGSTALAYSHYTVFFSKKISNTRSKNPVALTVVRFNSGDPNIDKHGVFEYMVDHSTGFPFTFNLSDEEFPEGTLVRHISMEIYKYSNVMTAPTGSLFWLTNNYLFDPVLPFTIVEERSDKERAARVVTGNKRLLTQGEKTEYQRKAKRTFRDGTVNISWWVLSAEGENPRNRITQYALVSKPVIVTYNGQKQGDFPNTIIKDDLRLPYLDRYLVVHVDCDRLDAESRRQLFPTTREALRDTPIGEDLRRLITETLLEDDELRRLDKERKQRYIRREDEGAVENIQRRLAKRVTTFKKTGGEGAVPRVLPPDTPTPPPSPRPPIPVQDPPTFIKITSPNPRRIYAGRSFTLRFETDARPEYFANPDSFIAVIRPPSLGQFTGTANVREGHGVAYFKATEGLEVDSIGEITLEVRPPRSSSLSASVGIQVVELPKTGTAGDGKTPTPNVNLHWVSEGDPFWIDQGWNKSSVAKVTKEEDSIDVYVSADNERLNHFISRAQRRDTAAVDSIKSFYLEHISYYSIVSDLDKKASTEEENAENGNGDSHELKHACDAICGIIDDIFEVLVTNTSSSENTSTATV